MDTEPTSIVATAARDRRWVRIRRPVVMVGGELTMDMLDLSFNPLAKFYEAPIQLKANGGVFLVDDFGRQRMRPEDLLPHRSPFLLLDSLDEVVPGHSARGRWHLTGEEGFFAGHFPGRPTVPGRSSQSCGVAIVPPPSVAA